jgi:hypothetical protein
MSTSRWLVISACLTACWTTPAPGSDDAEHETPPLITITYHVPDLVIPLVGPRRAAGKDDFEPLLDLIELRTGAECWKGSGGQGVIKSFESTLSLVIRQTPAVHERIADLLAEIRSTAGLAVSVECQVIHGRLEDCAASGGRSIAGLVDADGKQRLLSLVQSQKDASILAAPKFTFFDGQAARLMIDDEEGQTSLDIRGVVSKDNRYSRLWLNGAVFGEAIQFESLIPEGYSAVRKLPGDDRWLIVTSHVINADEPQRIAPRPAPSAPIPAAKRYLVPIDDSEDPAEVTHIPGVSAQAEVFGVTVKLAANLTGGIELELEGSESLADVSPQLAQGIERAAHQVAVAEPAFADDPAAIARLEDEESRRYAMNTEDDPACRAKLLREIRTKEPRPSVEVVHSFPVEAKTATGGEPPAVLNVFLNDQPDMLSDGVILSGGPPGPIGNSPLQPGQLFERAFNGADAPVVSGGVVSGWYLTPWGPGALMLLSRPVAPACEMLHGCAVDGSEGRCSSPPTPAAWEQVGIASVQQACGQAPAATSLIERLESLAEDLEQTGLSAEARSIIQVRDELRRRAHERCTQIDLQISTLKAERARWERLEPEFNVPSDIRY